MNFKANKRAGGLVQWHKRWPGKHKVLSSLPGTKKKWKNKTESLGNKRIKDALYAADIGNYPDELSQCIYSREHAKNSSVAKPSDLGRAVVFVIWSHFSLQLPLRSSQV